MRLSDRLHPGAHAEGSGRGLRGRITSRARRLALSPAALALLTLLIAGAGPVAAHSLLIESIPAADAKLAAPPRELVLRFNNRIEKKLSRVRLVGGKDARLEVPVAVTGQANTLTGPLPALTPGVWRLEWQVLSTDGHVVTGAFLFRLEP